MTIDVPYNGSIVGAMCGGVEWVNGCWGIDQNNMCTHTLLPHRPTKHTQTNIIIHTHIHITHLQHNIINNIEMSTSHHIETQQPYKSGIMTYTTLPNNSCDNRYIIYTSGWTSDKTMECVVHTYICPYFGSRDDKTHGKTHQRPSAGPRIPFFKTNKSKSTWIYKHMHDIVQHDPEQSTQIQHFVGFTYISTSGSALYQVVPKGTSSEASACPADVQPRPIEGPAKVKWWGMGKGQRRSSEGKGVQRRFRGGSAMTQKRPAWHITWFLQF